MNRGIDCPIDYTPWQPVGSVADFSQRGGTPETPLTLAEEEAMLADLTPYDLHAVLETSQQLSISLSEAVFKNNPQPESQQKQEETTRDF